MNPVMNASAFKSLLADRDSTATLVRRLLSEHALVHWRLYSIAFVLMAVTAACTAFSAYILGDVINEAYVDRNFPGIVTLAVISVTSTMPVSGARTTPVKKAAIPTTAKPSG